MLSSRSAREIGGNNNALKMSSGINTKLMTTPPTRLSKTDSKDCTSGFDLVLDDIRNSSSPFLQNKDNAWRLKTGLVVPRTNTFACR
jgi:hypothetical protein